MEEYEEHWSAEARRRRDSLAAGWPFLLIGAVFAVLFGAAVHLALVLAVGAGG